MAKRSKKTTTRRTGRREQSESSSESSSGSRNLSSGATMRRVDDYKNVLREFVNNPAVRYVAGGIATAVLARIATNMSERYPEISNFLKENLDTVEGKLSEFRNGPEGESARH